MRCSALPLLLALAAHSARADDPPPADDPDDVIVVTGTRTPQRLSDATVATEVVTREEIAASGARNAAELVETHTGAVVGNSFRGSTVSLRGLDPKYTLILVDGQRVAGTSDGAVDLSRFSADDIEQIEIVKGPASALYGADAMGGVINIRTRRSKNPVEASLSAMGGSRATSGASPVTEVPMDGMAPAMNAGVERLDVDGALGLVKGRWSSRGTGGLRSSGAYDLKPDDADTSGSAWREYSAGDRTDLRFTDDAKGNATLDYRRRETRGIDPGAGGALFDLTNLTEDLTAGAGADLLLDGPARLNVSARYNLYRDQFLEDQRGSDALDVYTDSRQNLGELTGQLDRVFGDHNTATVGVEGIAEALSTQRLSVPLAQRERGAVYAQDEWTLLEDRGVTRLVLLPGARVDVDTQFGTHASPKLALRLDPVERVVIRASYGLGYRAPDFKELYLYFENPTAGYMVQGNPDLKPETSRSAEIETTWEPVQGVQLGLSVFRNDIDNLIEPELVADDNPTDGLAPYAEVNVASARTQGAEASAALRIRDHAAIDLGYAFLDSLDNDTGLPLDGRAANRVTLEAQGYRLVWHIDATLKAAWIGRSPYTTDDNGDGVLELIYAPAVLDLGARLGRPITKEIGVFVGIDNAMDAGDAVYTRLPPRLVYAGLNLGWPGQEASE